MKCEFPDSVFTMPEMYHRLRYSDNHADYCQVLIEVANSQNIDLCAYFKTIDAQRIVNAITSGLFNYIAVYFEENENKANMFASKEGWLVCDSYYVFPISQITSFRITGNYRDDSSD